MTYKIWLNKMKNIEEGWWGGSNSRYNSVIYDRTDNKDDAFEMDDVNALQFYADFKKYGYSCEIIPNISDKRKLEILENGLM